MKMELDLHGLTEQDAYLKMLEFFSELPNNCKSVTVIHGFRGGEVLKKMVHNFTHHRIWSKQPGVMNPGQTIIFTSYKSNSTTSAFPMSKKPGY